MEDMRFSFFDKMELDFTPLSPFTKDQHFEEMISKSGIPMLKNGIILTALVDKGDALEYALGKIQRKYSKIIFVDDKMKFIESVQ